MVSTRTYIPIPPREETSEIRMLCAPADYSASHIARAVEDADAHLLSLNAEFGDDGSADADAPAAQQLHVTLRVSHVDPAAVVRSLERYGYEISSAKGSDNTIATVAMDRLLSLSALLNV